MIAPTPRVAGFILVLLLSSQSTVVAFVPTNPSIRHTTSCIDTTRMDSSSKFAVPPKVVLEQFAPQAASLFNNMKTPASILAGALVPLGLLAPLPDRPPHHLDGKPVVESRFIRILRLSYGCVAVLSLLSELISVMWATVAVNQLIETHVAPAESVWHLLRRDFDLPWLGTNAHFVAGMFGFSYVIALRAYLGGTSGTATAVGKAVSRFAWAALMLMVAIVNRGVSTGSGDGMRYGSSVLSLFSNYVIILFRRATSRKTLGPLEIGSIAFMAWGLVLSISAIWKCSAEEVEINAAKKK